MQGLVAVNHMFLKVIITIDWFNGITPHLFGARAVSCDFYVGVVTILKAFDLRKIPPGLYN